MVRNAGSGTDSNRNGMQRVLLKTLNGSFMLVIRMLKSDTAFATSFFAFHMLALEAATTQQSQNSLSSTVFLVIPHHILPHAVYVT